MKWLTTRSGTVLEMARPNRPGHCWVAKPGIGKRAWQRKLPGATLNYFFGDPNPALTLPSYFPN
jgi:hypothetical protein